MDKDLPPETPVTEISISDELLAFANNNSFGNFREMLEPGLNGLHQLTDFNYRLQREIIQLVVANHWDDLLEKE